MALSTEKKVGMFFVFGLIILGVLLEVGEKWNPFEKNIPYKTYLSSITGLKVGDPVRLAGVDVGRITDIKILENQIEIDFEVKPGTRIKTDTIAGLRLTNLLGGQFLGLSFGSPAAPLLPEGGTVRGKDVANIDIIVDNLSDVITDAKNLVVNLDKNQQQVLNRITVMLDENRGPLRGAISNINAISEKMDRGEGSLALLLNQRTLYDDAESAVQSFKSVAGKIDRGEGTLGLLINDQVLYRDAATVFSDLKTGAKDFNAGVYEIKEIAKKVNSGEGTIGKLVHDEALYTELRDASTSVKDIAQKINSGQGTIGKLVNEDQLYRDTTATLKKAERAMEGLGDTGPISVLGSIIGTLF